MEDFKMKRMFPNIGMVEIQEKNPQDITLLATKIGMQKRF